MKRLLIPVLLAFGLATATGASAAVTKYTFDGVTFSDGTSGVIEAAVKTTNKSHVTVCNYYSTGHVDFLGYYQDYNGSFASMDPAAVEQFCLDHYAERTV